MCAACHDNLETIRRIVQLAAGRQSGYIPLLRPRGDLDRLPSITILDARIQKDFALGGSSRLTLFLDALNLNNENTPQSVVSANVTNGQYQYPTTFVAPRRLMLSGKFSF